MTVGAESGNGVVPGMGADREANVLRSSSHQSFHHLKRDTGYADRAVVGRIITTAILEQGTKGDWQLPCCRRMHKLLREPEWLNEPPPSEDLSECHHINRRMDNGSCSRQWNTAIAKTAFSISVFAYRLWNSNAEAFALALVLQQGYANSGFSLVADSTAKYPANRLQCADELLV